MYPTPNELSSYSPAWPCAHFRLAGGVNALAGVLFLLTMVTLSSLLFSDGDVTTGKGIQSFSKIRTKNL